MPRQMDGNVKARKRLGLITYNTPHLKTEQILCNLLGKYDIKIYALPFVLRDKRRVWFRHRPDQSVAAHPRELCEYYGLPFVPVQRDIEIDDSRDIYLITGAGILSAEVVRGKRVINGHPGIIPAARGLDAFKWSIYNMLPLGVTLHYIDENVDAGEVISVVETPVFVSDSLESLARRHYENEIKLLSEFELYLRKPQNLFSQIPQGNPMRRMKYEQELELSDKFALYKERYCR